MAQKQSFSKLLRMLESFSTSKQFGRCMGQLKGMQLEGGNCTLCLKVEKEHTNVFGTLHGGLAATIVDAISFFALESHPKFPASSRPPFSSGVTLNLHISHLSPVKNGEDVFFKAKTINIKNNLAYVETSITNSDSTETYARGSMSSKKRSKDPMGSSKKMKRRDSASESEESETNEVQVDFSGFELAPCDFTGIQLLLQQLFLKTPVDLSDLSNYLIDQLDVGTVIKESEIDQNMENDDDMNEDDTVYALISVVDLAPSPDVECKSQLRNSILELSKEHATEVAKNSLHSVLNDPKNSVGLIINERYLNLPPTISVPSFSKLKNEIDAMSKKEPKFNFTHYLMICKLYKVPSSKKKNVNSQQHEVIWCNAEEEVFDQEADSRFEFPVTKESDSGLSGLWTEDDVEMLPFRRVLLFSAPKFDTIIKKISSSTQ